jgi:hypothetical protein
MFTKFVVHNVAHEQMFCVFSIFPQLDHFPNRKIN